MFCVCRAAGHGNKKAATLLVERGARIDARDVNGRTPLHISCVAKKEDIVQILVDNNADVNIFDDDDDMPIHLACKVGVELFALFLFYFLFWLMIFFFAGRVIEIIANCDGKVPL